MIANPQLHSIRPLIYSAALRAVNKFVDSLVSFILLVLAPEESRENGDLFEPSDAKKQQDSDRTKNRPQAELDVANNFFR